MTFEKNRAGISKDFIGLLEVGMVWGLGHCDGLDGLYFVLTFLSELFSLKTEKIERSRSGRGERGTENEKKLKIEEGKGRKKGGDN